MSLSSADLIRAACLLECRARKPGNVHPEADFNDVTYQDFQTSAGAIAPLLAETPALGIGAAVRASVVATREAVGTNTNLGMILLLAPLAAIPPGTDCQQGLPAVLESLTQDDARLVFEAICLAQPGGLGTSRQADVQQAPLCSLREAMSLAADRDLIARQYTNGYREVLGIGRETFLQAVTGGQDWETAVISTQLQLMSTFPDSLIARKCGPEIALESQRRARQVLSHGWPSPAAQPQRLALDQWLRQDGHRRNPGTTADLIAAILYVVLRDRQWTVPATLDLFHSLPDTDGTP